MELEKKELYLPEFSKTIKPATHYYLSFYKNTTLIEEFELLFNKMIKSYGSKHFGIYRICDAEYMYCVGRKLPVKISLLGAIRFNIKTLLINLHLINQKTGHDNRINKEFWVGENYSVTEKRQQKDKYLADVREIAKSGFLAPHLVYSTGHFSEEYIEPILDYYQKNNVPFNKDNYFCFYFVYMMMSLDKYKSILYKDKNVLIVTAFNERNKPENFKENLLKEDVKNVYFYNISHNKAMLEIIDKDKLPDNIDLVLIGAGIGSANIINQLAHLNALCIDAGHALDCLSRPQLRLERVFLLPDANIN